MVSSNVQEAKKIAARLHQLTKKFFDDFYAKAAKAGRSPGPHEAMVAFGRILKGAAEKEWPPPPRFSWMNSAAIPRSTACLLRCSAIEYPDREIAPERDLRQGVPSWEKCLFCLGTAHHDQLSALLLSYRLSGQNPKME